MALMQGSKCNKASEYNNLYCINGGLLYNGLGTEDWPVMRPEMKELLATNPWMLLLSQT